MARKTWSRSALGRVAALVLLLCAPWSAEAALQGPQDGRADVAAKLARLEELIKTNVREGKGFREARAPLDIQIVEIEVWLRGEASKLGQKDRMATAQAAGLVLAQLRPPEWWRVTGKSMQLQAAELLGELAPDGATVLLAALKAQVAKPSTLAAEICKSIGKQGTSECFAALVAAAGRKDGELLCGAAKGFSDWPHPTPEQRKQAFAAIIDGWGALNTQRATKGKPPLELDQEEINVFLPVTFTLGRMSGAKKLAVLGQKDWEAWWKEHKKGEWK